MIALEFSIFYVFFHTHPTAGMVDFQDLLMLTIPDITSCNLKCSRASKHGNKEFLIESVNEEDKRFISEHHEMPPQIQACTCGRANE